MQLSARLNAAPADEASAWRRDTAGAFGVALRFLVLLCKEKTEGRCAPLRVIFNQFFSFAQLSQI